MKSLGKVFNKALQEETLSSDEISALLHISGGEGQQALFETARTLRHRYFDNFVGLYGFVYFSTYCRNDCSFCLYRRSNATCERYRKTTEEIVTASKFLAESGVNLIDLTMGEDPAYLNAGEKGYEQLVDIVRRVKNATGLPVMISPGVVPKEVLKELKEAYLACIPQLGI